MAKRKSNINPKPATLESIMGAKLKQSFVDVEIGGEVQRIFVQEMTALQRQRRLIDSVDSKNNPKPEVVFAQEIKNFKNHVIDESGKLLFSNGEVKLADIQSLGSSVVSPTAKEIDILSGIGKPDEDDLEDWLSENHPDILSQFEEESSKVEQAKENFT